MGLPSHAVFSSTWNRSSVTQAHSLSSNVYAEMHRENEISAFYKVAIHWCLWASSIDVTGELFRNEDSELYQSHSEPNICLTTPGCCLCRKQPCVPQKMSTMQTEERSSFSFDDFSAFFFFTLIHICSLSHSSRQLIKTHFLNKHNILPKRNSEKQISIWHCYHHLKPVCKTWSTE